ncbi:unnamed protein product [Prunus armeniaca]
MKEMDTISMRELFLQIIPYVGRNIVINNARTNIRGDGIEEPALDEIVTTCPLLESCGRITQRLLEGAIDETFFVLGVEHHEHGATPGWIIFIIQELCDKDNPWLIGVMKVERIIRIIILGLLRLG